MTTMPIMLAGAMTVSMNVTGPIESASAAGKRLDKAKSNQSAGLRGALAAPTVSAVVAAPAAPVLAAPATYTVVAGDTVSSIAGRYGVSTASVLGLNGLGWKSLIFPGQVLKISGAAAPVASAPVVSAPASGAYTIVKGDTISSIAARYGVSTQAVLTANGLGWSSIIYPGQKLTIPSGSLAVQNVASVTPTVPPSTPVVSTPAPVISNTYKIASGDTVSSIAKRFGVSVQAVLTANGLGMSSIIYAGRTLVIPGVTAVQDGSSVTPLTDEMAANARIIIQVGQQLGVSDRGIVIALAAAMQESSLRNINYGDRDSVGLFQQRESAGWGAKAKLLDATYAARLFYGGPSNPNAGKTRGLLDYPGWESLTVTQAAQKVQISAYPNAYAKWETSAWAWLAQLR